jgi:carboxyl-terminal processing protease
MAEKTLNTSPMTTRTRLTIVLVTAPILAFVVVGGLLARAVPPREEAYPYLRVFDDVFSLTTTGYVEAVDAGRLMHGAMHGLAEALDSDSAYLTPDEAKVAAGRAPLPAGDVGLVLTRQYYLRVVAAIEGTPAYRAGVRSGDYIRVIDRKPTRDMSVWEGTRMMRGPVGSTLTLTILRGNATEPHVVELTREALTAPAVSTTTAPGGVGIVRIHTFSDTTPGALRDAIAQVQKSGAKAVALDLRNCAGGPLAAGIAAARLFVANGIVAQFESRGAKREFTSAGAGDGTVTIPLVVLVDSGTAGPAELLAAALVGNKRAELVGERTAGHAALQKLFPLPDGGALWMSYAQYFTVPGDAIHEHGVLPEVVVAQPDLEFGASLPPGDPTMDRAIERLRASGS